MSLAPFDRSASVGSRVAWVVLLCAVAVGIVGMHGLVSSADSAESAGHHVTQAVDLAPEAAGSHAASPDAGPVGHEEPPTQESGLLALCLMVLVPAVAVGLLLLARSRGGVRRLRRLLVRVAVAADVAVPPPPFRRFTVLRI